MSKQRIIKDEIWDDEWFYDLPPLSKLVWLFILTNPRNNIAGIYQLNRRWAAVEIGIDVESLNKIIERFKIDGKIQVHGVWIIVTNWVKHQSLNPKVALGIARIYSFLPTEIKQLIGAGNNNNNPQIATPKYKSIGAPKKARIHARDSVCVKCGSGDKLEVDHIVPIHLGGENGDDNLQLLCHDCHTIKSIEETSAIAYPTLLNSTLLKGAGKKLPEPTLKDKNNNMGWNKFSDDYEEGVVDADTGVLHDPVAEAKEADKKLNARYKELVDWLIDHQGRDPVRTNRPKQVKALKELYKMRVTGAEAQQIIIDEESKDFWKDKKEKPDFQTVVAIIQKRG